MKLTYWFAECLDDNVCYSIIKKTKRAAQLEREEKIKEHGNRYGQVVKREIIYDDAFDLMDQLTCEGGGRGYSNV
jgi:hypothetical protein